MLSTTLLFLDIGGPEMMLIMVAALLLFGGQKLPELAKGLGKGIRDFKDAANGVKDDLQESMNKLQEEPVKPVAELVDSHSNPYIPSVEPVSAMEPVSQPAHTEEPHLVDAHNHPFPSSEKSSAGNGLSDNQTTILATHPLVKPADNLSVPYTGHSSTFGVPLGNSQQVQENSLSAENRETSSDKTAHSN